MDSEILDHPVWKVCDTAGYKLSVVARLRGPGVSNVQYRIRMNDPKGEQIDYMLTLEGFKKLGELLIALHGFCRDPIFAREIQSVEKLKERLTAENITNWARLTELQSEKAKGKRQHL